MAQALLETKYRSFPITYFTSLTILFDRLIFRGYTLVLVRVTVFVRLVLKEAGIFEIEVYIERR